MPGKPVAVDPTAQAGRAHRWLAMLAWGLWALTPLALPVVNWLDQRLRQAGLSELADAGDDGEDAVVGEP